MTSSGFMDWTQDWSVISGQVLKSSHDMWPAEQTPDYLPFLSQTISGWKNTCTCLVNHSSWKKQAVELSFVPFYSLSFCAFKEDASKKKAV